MNYETEPWYKLYIRESTEDKVLPVLNRSFRDFLLRFAKSRNDGTILAKSSNPGEDIARALGAHPTEFASIVGFVASMLDDGYLNHRKGRLSITNFVAAQEARSAGARRQKVYRDKHNSSRIGISPSDVNVAKRDVTVASHVTSQEIRSDPKRDEERPGEETRGRAPDPPDPFGESLTSVADELPEGWQPNAKNAALAKRLKLSLEDELAEYTAHRRREGYRCAAWDSDFELWLRRSKRFALERDRRSVSRPTSVGGPSADWPTETDLSLREAIRGGAHGPRLKTLLDADRLDAALAKRLIREQEGDVRDRSARPERSSVHAAPEPVVMTLKHDAMLRPPSDDVPTDDVQLMADATAGKYGDRLANAIRVGKLGIEKVRFAVEQMTRPGRSQAEAPEERVS